MRDSNDLLGKHLNAMSGDWTERRSGIGSNSDSMYEYLIKSYQLFADEELFEMFRDLYSAGIFII